MDGWAGCSPCATSPASRWSRTSPPNSADRGSAREVRLVSRDQARLDLSLAEAPDGQGEEAEDPDRGPGQKGEGGRVAEQERVAAVEAAGGARRGQDRSRLPGVAGAPPALVGGDQPA